MKDFIKLKKMNSILFHAAAGGVGLLACQWAKSMGCKMIGTVSSNEKAKLAKNEWLHSLSINYKKKML